MRLTEEKRNDINNAYKLMAGCSDLKLEIQTAFSSCVYDKQSSFPVCEVSEISKMIHALKMIRDAVEKETGVQV